MLSKIIVSGISLVLVVGVLIGVIYAFGSINDEKNRLNNMSIQRRAVLRFCAPTEFKDMCIKTLTRANTPDAKELIKTSIISTQAAVQRVMNLSDSLIGEATKTDNNSRVDLEDCKVMLHFAIEDLKASLTTVRSTQLPALHHRTDDLMPLLNAVVTYQQTCLDGFEGQNNTFKDRIQNAMVDAREQGGNLLSTISGLPKILESFGIKLQPPPNNNRRLLQVDNVDYPSWFPAADRKLLAEQNSGSVTPDVVVAKDGSGNYSTIQEAIDAYPNDLHGRYVVYVKTGVYPENVTLTKNHKNVFIYGDGMAKTIVTANNSNTDGYNTINTATFTAVGEGFIAKLMGFANTAGPDGRQATALRVQADKAAIFDCRIDGYENTLYTHAYRQFYRSCVISGTVDFIFGDATVIIQNSYLIVRRPKDLQFNTVTAQGRELSSQTTSLVIHNCTIVPDEKLFPVKGRIRTYLGRPWKNYATTVFLENTIAEFVQPEGYVPLGKTQPLENIKYLEYKNRGAGAWSERRVKWPGVREINKEEAQIYTVQAMLQGHKWLKDVGIPYHAGLMH